MCVKSACSPPTIPCTLSGVSWNSPQCVCMCPVMDRRPIQRSALPYALCYLGSWPGSHKTPAWISKQMMEG